MRRTTIIFVTALAASAIVAERAVADRQPITFVTSERLKQICAQQGGTFWDDGSGYSCSKECGRKKRGRGWCSVDCSSATKECVGRAPTRLAPGGDIQQVLND
jgi:hypothetical protein